MTYLSRGLPVNALHCGEICVSLHGKAYALGPKLTALWNSARNAPKPVQPDSEHMVRRLVQSGLAVTAEDCTGELAAYRLLSQCILCPVPDQKRRGRLPLIGQDRRIWMWISGAGLRLTACELIRLEEQHLQPAPALLGETNRLALTEAIYTTGTIADGILETHMEHSPARNRTVSALLRLLRSNRLFLA